MHSPVGCNIGSKLGLDRIDRERRNNHFDPTLPNLFKILIHHVYKIKHSEPAHRHREQAEAASSAEGAVAARTGEARRRDQRPHLADRAEQRQSVDCVAEENPGRAVAVARRLLHPRRRNNAGPFLRPQAIAQSWQRGRRDLSRRCWRPASRDVDPARGLSSRRRHADVHARGRRRRRSDQGQDRSHGGRPRSGPRPRRRLLLRKPSAASLPQCRNDAMSWIQCDCRIDLPREIGSAWKTPVGCWL